MSLPGRTIKWALEKLPDQWRHRLKGTSTIIGLRRAFASWRWRDASHDQVYGSDYFDFVERTTASSAATIAQSIVAAFGPKRVIDVGCGTGALLLQLRELGVAGYGLEYAHAALTACLEKGLDVQQFDITQDSFPGLPPPDVVISMEVGHQLPSLTSDRYVDLLCSLSNTIVFSSDTLGGGDRLPLNEQPHSYWIEKFVQRGFTLDAELTETWRLGWSEKAVADWFCRNVMVFRCVGSAICAPGTSIVAVPNYRPQESDKPRSNGTAILDSSEFEL